ncbi:hypothetical protein PC121_g4949 [Phytophthora cactorum]|nr:hypothetical protein PC121_g4949 [Phytophthora cactorum]
MTRQAVLAVANAQHRESLRAHVQPGCTKKRYAIKPGLIVCVRGKNPPTVSTTETRPRPGLDEEQVEPGSTKETTAQATQAAQVSVRDRDATRDVCRADIGHDVECRDVERLDTDPYWSPVRVNATGESSTSASELTSLPAMSWMRFAMDLYDGRIEQICISDLERVKSEAEELRQLHAASTTESEDTLSAKTKKERFDGQSWDSLKASPFYDVLREHKDVLPTRFLRSFRRTREYSTRLTSCRSRRQAGQVRESKSPHSAPTFCVKKPQGGWRIVHAYNKLNDTTIPAQTSIPRKDVIIDSMAKITIYSALDLRDGFYQILMRESDITLTAVITPSGMLWEWLVMPQVLKNAPATFNRCVTQLLRSVRDFAPSYFDAVFVHSRAVNGKTDVDVHMEHLRKLLGLMRKHKLYANLKKCIFGASEIPILGCLVGKNGVRPDPEMVRVISEWPTLSNVKELRRFLGLAMYLCKYVENYAGKIRPLS